MKQVPLFQSLAVMVIVIIIIIIHSVAGIPYNTGWGTSG